MWAGVSVDGRRWALDREKSTKYGRSRAGARGEAGIVCAGTASSYDTLASGLRTTAASVATFKRIAASNTRLLP